MFKYILLALALIGLLFFATQKPALQASDAEFSKYLGSKSTDEESYRK
jgi:hypothetical protein